MIGTKHTNRDAFANLWGWPVALVVLALVVPAGMLIAVVPQSAFLMLGAVGVIAYALLAYARPFAAFVVLVFLALTVWLSVIEVAPGVSLMIGVGLVFTAIWLSRVVMRTTIFVKVREYGWLLGLTAVVLVSALFNLDGPAGLSPVFTYFQLFLLFVLVVNLATTPARLHILSIALVASSVLLALLILLNQFDLLPPGLVREQIGNILVEGGTTAVARATGLWGGPNMTAVQLTIALPFLIEWWPAARNWGQRLLFLGMVAAIIAALFFTFSVGGMIGLFAMLFVRATVSLRRDDLFSISRMALAAILAVLVLSVTLPDLFMQRFVTQFNMFAEAGRTLDTDLLLSLGTGRGDTWLSAVRSIASSPLLGHGPGNATFDSAQYSILQYGIVHGPHNMFFSIGGDLGLVGLALFTGLLVSAILTVGRSWHMQTEDTILRRTGRALFIALVAYAVQSLALDIQTLKLLWILLGMAAACKLQHTGKVPDMPATR